MCGQRTKVKTAHFPGHKVLLVREMTQRIKHAIPFAGPFFLLLLLLVELDWILQLRENWQIVSFFDKVVVKLQ